MNITKPNTQSIVAAAAMLLTFIGTLLTWWSVDFAKSADSLFKVDASVAGVDYTKGVFVMIFALLALALFVATLFISAFPENIQMPLLGAPIFQAILAVPALLLTVIAFFSSGMGDVTKLNEIMSGSVDVDRGFGLYLTLIAVLVWLVVTAIQAKPLVEAAQAMKAAAAQENPEA